jgi:hypothetical protein
MSTPPSSSVTSRTPRLGLPVWAVLALAVLAVPRAVLHDLDMMPGDRLAGVALALGPPLIWVIVAVAARVPSPLATLSAVGTTYGVALALVHNLLGGDVFGDRGARLGGNLEGELPAALEEVVLRGAATVSSLLTGLAVGLLSGFVAAGVRRLTRSVRRDGDPESATRYRF